MQNKNTIEVRIFRGTLKNNSFHKNFEFVHGVYEFCRDIAQNKNTVAGFKAFIAGKKEYMNLNNFIAEKRL
jgi:hypothetical protein